MELTLLYFDGCPNSMIAYDRLVIVADELKDVDVTVTRRLVETLEDAERTGFRGSPSILVDGVDLFGEFDAPFGLSCRRYRTPDGPTGAPTVEQLRTALKSRQRSARAERDAAN